MLNIRNLTVDFDTEDGMVHAVQNVSFSIGIGQTVGLVGESGCGKSVTAMSIPRLIPQPPGKIVSGTIEFCGKNLLTLPIDELQRMRGRDIGVIFQEPMTALSPLKKIRSQLYETVLLHRQMEKHDLELFCLDWLKRVGIAAPERCMNSFPFELSGGMRQRVMIAMALMLEPRLVIADEPTTALDVTIQAQILELIRALKTNKPDSAMLLITHDLGVVWEICDFVIVMYAGQIVEAAPVDELFSSPCHPYTVGLLKSIPIMDKSQPARLYSIPGNVPSLTHLPDGCRFATRCEFVCETCVNQQQNNNLYPVDSGRQHITRCNKGTRTPVFSTDNEL